MQFNFTQATDMLHYVSSVNVNQKVVVIMSALNTPAQTTVQKPV